MIRRLAVAAGFALALVSGAHAQGPTMAFGATEDAVRSPDLVSAKARMTLLRLAGFTSVAVSSQWLPGEKTPSDSELQILRNVVAAAQLSGVTMYMSVYSPGSRTTPLTAEAREQFAAYTATLARRFPYVKDVIVGNEPNLNRFWMPQFGVKGSDVAASAYVALLARTYDVVKAVSPGTRIWGGALAPRGNDRANTSRDTHSPVVFLRDMGAAFRSSGRATPIMDGLAFHPYANSSGQSPDTPHPKTTTIGIADYDHLVATLGRAFDGTAQAGSSLPVLYSEFGVESEVPPGKAAAYTGREPATTRPVDETTQGEYYTRALELAFCQPNVVGLLFFHSQDEPALASWQSGVYYADGTPKSSVYAVRDALVRARGGSIARCKGLALDVGITRVRFPTHAELSQGRRTVTFTCDLDCAWELRARRVPGGSIAAGIRGYARAGIPVAATFSSHKLGSGTMQLSLTLTHPVNPGSPVTRESRTPSLR